MSWADSRRESGFRDRLIWFTPEGVAGLEKLQEENPGKSLADIVSAAVVQASSIGLASLVPPVVPDVLAELVEIKARLAKLEAAQAADTFIATASTGERIVKGSAAHARLLELIADRIARDGEGFSRADLHRDIQAAGVKAPALARNFATFARDNLVEAQAILAQRKQRAA